MTKKIIASQFREVLPTLSEMTYKFQQRLLFAYKREDERRAAAGEHRLTYTQVWKAAKASSGAATKWFEGENGMALETCVAVKDVLRCNPFWLYDESMKIDDVLVPKSTIQTLKSGAISNLDKRLNLAQYRILTQHLICVRPGCYPWLARCKAAWTDTYKNWNTQLAMAMDALNILRATIMPMR